MANSSAALRKNSAAQPQEEQNPAWINAIALLVWLAAGTVAFLPFAFDTSPWDAVTFRVPGNQGNWWHFLAGAPAFLAFPMIWLRLRPFFSTQPSTAMGRRLIWVIAGLSVSGSLAVQAPFLLHLAGTSDWQRFIVLGLGFGIVVASTTMLVLRRRRIAPTLACLAGLDAAYLANMALCLVVYAGAPGSFASRSGWFIAVVIIWPIVFELIWIFMRSFRRPASRINQRAA